MSSEHAKTLRKMAQAMLALADSLDGTGPGRGSEASSRDERPIVADIDGQYGNPTVRKDPKRWDGESYKGALYSDCPPDYLECLAGYLEWCADKDSQKGTADGDKYARYGRTDAARARAWAERIRSGGAAQASPEDEARAGVGDDDGFDDGSVGGSPGQPIGDDDVPF